MATKATVLDLVTSLSYGLADTAEIDRIWGELIIDLANDPRQFFSNVVGLDSGTVADLRDQEQLELPAASNIGRVIALFYQGRQLSREDERTFATKQRTWPDRIGRPVAFTTDQRGDRFLRLFPKNDTFDVNSVVLFYTQSVRTTSIQDFYALPLALLVLAREFERESNHRDMDFSKACRALGTQLMNWCVPQ